MLWVLNLQRPIVTNVIIITTGAKNTALLHRIFPILFGLVFVMFIPSDMNVPKGHSKIKESPVATNETTTTHASYRYQYKKQ